MIELRRLTKKFGSFTAVDNLSLRVEAGEYYGFLGPNGAGKTTTIKMMTGLFAPTAGEVYINGYSVQKDPLQAKYSFGYIPDQPFLYEKLTGREFLYFIGGMFKMNKTTIGRRIENLIDHFEIGSWIDKRTEEYSQGMCQRITIAAALFHDPKVIIVDEPMIGLDPRSARIVMDTLKKFTADGNTVFMSTHSLPVAEELCDRIGIIKDGRLIFEDTSAGLQSYKQKFDGKFESVFLELTK
ncbi:MAG: ABC transporter ATP-binding protein [Bacteroidota bacterium]